MSTAVLPSVIATRRLSADEFWDFCQRPEHAGRSFELVRGEVLEMPRPGVRHGVVATRLARYLDIYAEQVGQSYVTSNDIGLVLERSPDTVRGPDVAYYVDVERYAELPVKWNEIAPKLIVEVLSPTDPRARVTKKIGNYLSHGVAVVWLADPEEKTVTAYRLHHAPRVFEGSELLTVDELPGFAHATDTFFRLPGDRDSA